MRDVEWREIPGWQGVYEVSNHGLIRSVDRRVSVKGGSRLSKGRVMVPDKTANGAHRVTLQSAVSGKIERVSVPRVVAEVFIGPPPEDKPWVLHWDDNRENNHVSNLRWGDAQENVLDAIRNGRHPGAATHCPKGHPYSDGPGTSTRRRCSLCELTSDRVRYRERVDAGLPEDDPRHGTYAGYRAGCRLDCCKEANSSYKKAHHLRKKAL